MVLGRMVVKSPHPPTPLFYYVKPTDSPGERMAPDELMHQKGWRDLKEILISILTGKSKRPSDLPTTQKEAAMLQWVENPLN